jgi:hypothetical protein
MNNNNNENFNNSNNETNNNESNNNDSNNNNNENYNNNNNANESQNNQNDPNNPPYSEEVDSEYQKQLHLKTIGECEHDDLDPYVPGPGDVCDFFGDFGRPHQVAEAQVSSLAFMCRNCFGIMCHDCYQEYGEFTEAPIEEANSVLDSEHTVQDEA